MKSKNLAKAIALGLVLGSMSFVSMEAQAANLTGPLAGNAAKYSDLRAVNNQVEKIDQRVERMDQVLSNAADKDYVDAAVKEEETERKDEDARIEGEVRENRESINANKEAIAEEAAARQNADDTLNEKIDRNAAATQEQIDGINVTNEKQDNAIATNTKNIADNKEQIATNEKNIAANTEAIESNREYFESRVNHNQEQIDANKEAIADVNGKVGDAQYSSENYIAKGDDLTTAAGKLDAAVKAEETKRQNEDARIEGKVDAETNRAKNEEKRIEDKVDAETNRAQNEEKRIEQKFDGEVSRLDSKIDKLDNRVEKVGAMAAAIANLHTMGYDPAAPTEVAVGVGQYRDKTGLALGAFHYPNRDVMVSFSISTAGEEYMAGVGATWKFGRKSPEAMLKAEKEKAARKKLAQETAAKKAAEDAAVAVQQAKHSEMLAAESK